MKAAAKPTTIELRRGASSPLKPANRPGQVLSDYTNHNESDLSGDYCGSELHSPLSMNSIGSSEKVLSPSDYRNNSDLSEGCPSPVEKDEGFLEADMIPSTESQHTPQKLRSDRSSSNDRSERDRKSKHNKETSSSSSSRKNQEVHNSDDEKAHKNMDSSHDQKQVVDIVGGASSPGEFFHHALEFINRGENEERHRWTSNDLKKPRSMSRDEDMPESKRMKTNNHVREDDSALYASQRNEMVAVNSLYRGDKRDIKRPSHPPMDISEKPCYYPLLSNSHDGRMDEISQLTQDQKFFVEAFKREVTSAAEQAAEASALRILEILETQGISFRRCENLGKQGDDMVDTTKLSLSRTPLTSSPISEKKVSRGGQKSQRQEVNDLPKRSEPEGKSQSHSGLTYCDARGTPDKSTIDLSAEHVGRSSSTNNSDRGLANVQSESRRKKEVDEQGEQNQALSLVTKQSRSPRSCSVDVERPPSPDEKSLRDSGKSTSAVGQQSTLHPFVRSAQESKSAFPPSLSGLPISSAFRNSLHFTPDRLLGALPEGSMEAIDRRARGSTADESYGEKMMDYSPFSAAAARSPRSKSSFFSKSSSYYKEDKKLSPRRHDDKSELDMNLQTSLALHGVPSASAFRKHDSRRSPTSSGMRSLRSNGSPESKTFPTPSPFGMMYPFTNLPFPLGVPQSPHLAAVSLLASFNQRQHQNDYRNIRNGQPTIPTDRIPVHHPSLRGHPNSSYLGDHHGYDVDSSSYAFPSNMQDGLTPQHLKKAKLMFFYMRYPNGNMLKQFFPDVKFSRAITSQLIKWFSNFREFFYIQMEKFARQAITDGIQDASMLRVTRDCELFRVLNLHYNKCNEFHVPNSFLTVAEASQREFFNAVKGGKDADPSWKKVIYKVICKLDADIPELFKSINVLDRLHEIRD